METSFKDGAEPRNPAERAGMSIADLSEIETGTRDGSISTITRIADALRLMLDDLVCSWTLPCGGIRTSSNRPLHI